MHSKVGNDPKQNIKLSYTQFFFLIFYLFERENDAEKNEESKEK